MKDATKKPKAKKSAPKATAKRDGLRQPQLRILAALAKHGKPLTRKEISKHAPCDLAWLTSWLGSDDAAVRAKNDKAFPSLLSLKLVQAAEAEGPAAYSITAAGKKALAAEKENGQ